MTKNILDDEIYFSGFLKPETFQVNKKRWVKLCSQLENKSMIWVVLIVFLTWVGTRFIFGNSFFAIALVLALFSGFKMKKKFKQLKNLGEDSFEFSKDRITHYSNQTQRTFLYADVKTIDFVSWGIEIHTQPLKAKSRILVIPQEMDGFHRITKEIKEIMKSNRS